VAFCSQEPHGAESLLGRDRHWDAPGTVEKWDGDRSTYSDKLYVQYVYIYTYGIYNYGLNGLWSVVCALSWCVMVCDGVRQSVHVSGEIWH
jgi:hypothetical protein